MIEQAGQRILHPFPALCAPDSRILILGSFPSPKSREALFFYGHPQNRFWRVVSDLLNVPTPHTIEDKKAMLLQSGIALWDVLASCVIQGAADSTIREETPNDIACLLAGTQIRRIFCNGDASYRLYTRYCAASCGMDAVRLPSTSPANAAWSFERLCEAWRVILAE